MTSDDHYLAAQREHPHETADAVRRSSPEGTTARRGWGARIWRPLAQIASTLAAMALVLVLLGLAQKADWVTADPGGGAQAATGGGERYICPMMCTPPQTVPGRCPVCAMELVVADSSGNQEEFAVTIEPAARRLTHIETAAVKALRPVREIRSVGEIVFDESRLATIAAYVDGRIEQLHANYTGVDVEQGEPLARLYSPDLYGAQAEFLLSLEQGESAAGGRDKLRELGMTDGQIARLRRRGTPQARLEMHAPHAGTVIEKRAVEGDYLQEGQAILEIADLSAVWLKLELFPEQAARVRYGQRVRATVKSLPGKRFEGRVAFVDPVVNERTRTVAVRVEIPNPEGQLRPGDYAVAYLQTAAADGPFYDPQLAGKWISPRHPQIVFDEPGVCPQCNLPLAPTSRYGYSDKPLGRKTLLVPRQAVLRTGDDSIVYVETDPGRFEIRPVELGPATPQGVVVLKGVKQGEQVATRGNFLIDSQMQLAGNPSLIDPAHAIEEAKKPKPLELRRLEAEMIAGPAGRRLDDLYAAYFQIQAALAADETPPPTLVSRLSSCASEAAAAAAKPAAQELLRSIAADSKALQGDDREAIRQAFKPVSHAMVRLAGRVRGPQSTGALIHYYCPMVKGGGGDWLQPQPPLANPYWGSRMLRCGRQVHELQAEASISDSGAPERLRKADHSNLPPTTTR